MSPLAAAENVNGWDCLRLENGKWDCRVSTVPPPEPPAIVAKPAAIEPPPAEAEPAPPAAAEAPAEPAPVPESPPAVASEPEAPAPEPAPEPAPVATTDTTPPRREVEPEPTSPTPVAASEPEAPAPEPGPAPAVVAEPAPPAAIVEAKPAPEPTPAPASEPEPAPAAVTAPPVEPAPAVAEAGGSPAAPGRREALTRYEETSALPGFELCGSQSRPAHIEADPVSRRRTPLQVDADRADVAQEGISTFEGNVNLRRADQRMRANRVEYNRDSESVLASGDVVMVDNTLELSGAELRMDLVKDTGEVNDAEYRLYDHHARGTSAQVARDNVANITTLTNTTYTTCNPGNEDWQLRADKITLNHNEGFGTAEDVSVRFLGVPFFYSPWMTFPIDDRRKSGFLVPSFGNSDASGTELVVPYYWNIAPDRDATLAPRLLSSRGLQLNGEFRYLTEHNNGQVGIEYLPSDNKYDNEDRVLLSYQHKGNFAPRWSTDVNFNYASDREYFEDLGTDLSISSITHLERRLDVRYQGDYFTARGRLHDYQVIDRTAPDQYARLPQILLNAYVPDSALGLDYGLKGEIVHFDRDNTVTGTRVDIEPEIRLPLANSWAFLTPKLGYRYTYYNLDNNQVGSDDSPDRGLPIVSLDSGLYFDREFNLSGHDLLQTLEPRAYYLYIPKRNQDQLITDPLGNDVVFDTSEYDFSFAQLFRENRFTGADRVNDADQLTLALTTRVVDPNTGNEHFKASIGEIIYFQDREVVLPGQSALDNDNSDFVAEVNARFTNDWSGRAGIQWDTEEHRTDKSAVNVRYQPDEKRVINLAYRRLRGTAGYAGTEQTDLSFSWPATRQVNLVGRWNYSLAQSRTLDGFAGFEYESCCYVVRLVGRRYVNSIDPLIDTNENNVIMLQLELKGLAGVGDGVKSFLENGILGYGRDPQDDF